MMLCNDDHAFAINKIYLLNVATNLMVYAKLAMLAILGMRLFAKEIKKICILIVLDIMYEFTEEHQLYIRVKIVTIYNK